MAPASSALVRTSGVIALAGVFVEAAAAGLAITPAIARLQAWAWAPFLVAATALALVGSPAGRRGAVAGPLGLVAAVALGLGLGAVGTGAIAGAGPAFAAVLVAGEIFAVGVLVAGGSDAVAAGASLFIAALVTSSLAIFGDRLDIAMAPGGVALGGGIAALQLAAARFADGAVAERFGERDVVAAAAARLTEVPRRLILAVLGQQPV